VTIATEPSTAEILRMPGYLYKDPTNLAAEANYGTLLGFSEGGIEVVAMIGTALSRAEERGIEPVAKWYLGAQLQIRAVLKNYNATVLAAAFPGLVTGSSVQYPSTIVAGTRLDSATYAHKLLFMPVDQCATNKLVLFQYAVPNLEANARLRAQTNVDLGFPVVWDAFRHPSASGANKPYATMWIGTTSGVTLITA